MQASLSSGICAKSRCAVDWISISRAASSAAGSTGAPPQAMPATRATSRRTLPFAQSLPRRTIGTERMPSVSSSPKAFLSSSTLTDTKGTPCLLRNSFIRRQLVQPGCQYALITEASADDCVMGVLLADRAQDTVPAPECKDMTL